MKKLIFANTQKVLNRLITKDKIRDILDIITSPYVLGPPSPESRVQHPLPPAWTTTAGQGQTGRAEKVRNFCTNTGRVGSKLNTKY